MLGLARLGDRTLGVCHCHKDPITVYGTIITASSDQLVNNRGQARVGDIVRADCGHTGTIITGKPTHIVSNRLAARLGDQFEGCYTGRIITASSDTF